MNEKNQDELIEDMMLSLDALINLVGRERFAAEKLRLTEAAKDRFLDRAVQEGVFRRVDEVVPGCYVMATRSFDGGVEEIEKQRFPIDTQTEEVKKLFSGRKREEVFRFDLNGQIGTVRIYDVLMPVNPDAS